MTSLAANVAAAEWNAVKPSTEGVNRIARFRRRVGAHLIGLFIRNHRDLHRLKPERLGIETQAASWPNSAVT